MINFITFETMKSQIHTYTTIRKLLLTHSLHIYKYNDLKVSSYKQI